MTEEVDSLGLPNQEEVEEANQRFQGIVQIKGTVAKGWGVFAQKNFSKDDIVIVGKASARTANKTRHTAQKDWNEHIWFELPALYLNHSCDAKLGIQDNEHGAYDFVARKDIREGEEVNIDYETFEWQIQPFQCLCGSSRCRGMLRGFKYSKDPRMQSYGQKFIANYLKGSIPQLEKGNVTAK
eukprot:CAMPEP_0117759628 /NCGR_PEP_ID=MMETSP0947-20121206/16125_1 /TAXON_ID=44440 /ORGANISM="Chattonella subsalsa, Strain CCMP2191" /LENGTH=182 /DNA_ID=CAMNT_0005580119 /DNA_START=89 /DNA_END=637 /DNA_ORIENTATION=+